MGKSLTGKTVNRIVVKLGTSTLTAGTPNLSPPRLVDLVRQMWQLHCSGNEIVVVSSGAIATGHQVLNFPDLSKSIPSKQMLAAVGQPRLMALYQQLFGLYDITVAQVLLTRKDILDRRSYLNARNTINALLAHQVVPIINENDTVATEEIRVGDNDNLSGLVANLLEANLLVLLTDQPGLFSADPRTNSSARLIDQVAETEIPEQLWLAAGWSTNGLGTGGMLTKLQAADLARRSGAAVVIAQGKEPDVILRVVAGERIGTRIHPVGSMIESRKRFILAGAVDNGCIIVDEGTVKALRRGNSLLPAGVVKIRGAFERGDIIHVEDPLGREIARGLSNYASADLIRIVGCHSENIEGILGYAYGDEVIHRNNLVLL